MWTAFVHLLWHAFRETVSEKGTTLLAVIVVLVSTAIQQIIAGRQAMMANLKNWKTYIGTLVGFGVWCAVFLYTTASIVYDEHVSMKAAIVSLAQPHREGPDFRPAIVSAGVFPAGDRGNSNVFIVGTIYNRGTSGNLNDISIEAVFDDGKRVIARLANPFDPRQTPWITIGKNNQGRPMELPGSMYWLNQKDKLIPGFGRLDGFAAGILVGVTKDEIEKKRPTFVLTCSDIADRRATATYKWGSGSSGNDALALRDLQRPLHKRIH